MDSDLLLEEIQKNKKVFDVLDVLCHKDIKLNSIGIRILGVHYMDYGINWSNAKHKHTFFEYHYVISGHVYTTLGNTEYKVEEGQSYIIPPGLHHSHLQKDGMGHIGFALRWEFTNKTVETDELNADLLDSASNPLLNDEKIGQLLVELLNSAVDYAYEAELQIQVLNMILNIGKSKHSPEKHSLKDEKKLTHNRIAEQAIRFIEENYTEDIFVEDVASSVYLSYSQLARIFRKYVGVTVNQYINEYRIDKAKRLLKSTDREIKTIAGDVGFNSEYYFCNAFKNHVGMTPSCYRSENMGGLLNE